MSLSIHDAAVSTTLRALRALSAVLEKGRLHAETEKWDQSALLAMRLYPDMFTLTHQVQVVSDNCKGLIARLASIEPPKFADSEATFAELRQRLDRTIDFIQGVDANRFEGADQRAIELKFPSNTLKFSSGWEYFLAFAVPNIYFHSSMAYGILRNCGVRLGKPDFIGRIS